VKEDREQVKTHKEMESDRDSKMHDVPQDKIKTEHFTVGYGKTPLLKDISITVRAGEIFTLIGPNGSGKSTILKSITRQIRALGGTVYLDGKGYDSMKEIEMAKLLSMVSTERIKPELMTCRQVVATGRYPYTGKLGILTGEDWEKVEQSMEIVNAKEVADDHFMKISDGQKQRVMLARAICQDTQIMVLDEPTSYLDMRYKLDILSNIRKMAKEQNLAIIMSLHELDLAQIISDTIACVKGDHIDRMGTPEEIFAGDYVQSLYGIAEKSFDSVLGLMHLPANMNPPKVFVIGGGGAGIAVYHRLQRKNVPFAAGILHKNDMEYRIAKATASEILCAEAFSPIDEEQLVQGKSLIDRCEICLCAVDSFGVYNMANKELRDYAQKIGKLKNNI